MLLAFAAGHLDGKWVYTHHDGHTSSITIKGSKASVNASGGPDGCGGNFVASVQEKGHEVILKWPITPEPGNDPFIIHLSHNGNRLVEVKPYPLQDLNGIDKWHGGTCGFGLGASSIDSATHKPAEFTRK